MLHNNLITYHALHARPLAIDMIHHVHEGILLISVIYEVIMKKNIKVLKLLSKIFWTLIRYNIIFINIQTYDIINYIAIAEILVTTGTPFFFKYSTCLQNFPVCRMWLFRNQGTYFVN